MMIEMLMKTASKKLKKKKKKKSINQNNEFLTLKLVLQVQRAA